MRTRLLPLLVVIVAAFLPCTIGGSSFDESLRDDVFAMVATTQVMNMMLVLDSSEQMNSFTYSGYLESCEDAKSKVRKSITLCEQACDDCLETAANIDSCAGSLDCTSTCMSCNQLKCSEEKLISPSGGVINKCTRGYCEVCNDGKAIQPGFCYVISAPSNPNNYSAPGLTEIDTWDGSKALRFVGPWNPSRDDYMTDLCFYDWATDTGADIPNDADYSYSQYGNDYKDKNGNPIVNKNPADRRDWSCVSSTLGEERRSGLWLNWKFTTSLDALKIVLADDHRFGYAPHKRGSDDYECREKDWRPTDGAGKCFDSVGPAGEVFDATLWASNPDKRQLVRELWQEIDLNNVDTGITTKEECLNKPFNALTPADPTVASDSGDPDICSSCYDFYNTQEKCDQGKITPQPPAHLFRADTLVVFAQNLLSTCRVFHCAEPKCRDDETPSSLGCGTLGAYSEWDQDPAHCYSPVGDPAACNEATEFCCVEPGGGGSSYLPGPNTVVTQAEEDYFNMAALADTEFYTLAELTGGVAYDLPIRTKMRFTSYTDRVKKLKVSFYYGCRYESPNKLLFSQEYDPATDAAILAGDIYLNDPLPLNGCDTKSKGGYRIKVALTITHNENPGLAAATLAVTPYLAYDVVTPSVVTALNPNRAFFRGWSWVPKGSTNLQKVYEYECKTIFYSLKSEVTGGSCPGIKTAGYPACLKTGTCPVPYPGCTREERTQIGGGCDPDYVCTWLCPDAPQYDDVWKCKGFFEQNASQPAPDGYAAPGGSITCEPGSSVYNCCQSVNNFASHYEVFPPQTFDSNTYKDITGSNPDDSFKCGMSSVQIGIQSGKKRWISGHHVEITKGHINELPGGGAYLLEEVNGGRLNNGKFKVTGTNVGQPTPYAFGDKWYSSRSLVNKGQSALAASFVSIFRNTQKNIRRDPACIYPIVQDIYGEDCDTCGLGCCTMDLGDINYCDYPSFWIKVANSDGGNLILPPTAISTKKEEYQKMMRELQGIGGATMGETLYDVWRYLGGLKPAYSDVNTYPLYYPSPIKSDPKCFINSVMLVSGGQPQFDSNIYMDQAPDAALNSTFPLADPKDPPLVCNNSVLPGTQEVISVDPGNGVPVNEKLSKETLNFDHPYYIANWYKTALPQVACFVTQHDAYHSDDACRLSAATNYRFGLTGGPCAVAEPAGSESGNNVIDRIDTIGIGGWALAPIYQVSGNDTGYLDPDATLKAAALPKDPAAKYGPGKFYSLAPGSTYDNTETFATLTDIFNQMATTYSGTRSVGRPHFSSSPVQIWGKFGISTSNVVFLPGVVPVSNSVSRFWLGNLKKYYLWRKPSKPCVLGDNGLDSAMPSETDCFSAKVAAEDIEVDCFNQNTDAEKFSGANASSFIRVLGGGAAKNIAEQLADCTSNNFDCYTNNLGEGVGRDIYYDDPSKNMVELAALTPAQLAPLFGNVSVQSAAQIVDYVFGYDSMNHDASSGNTQTSQKRSDLPPITVPDPLADPDTEPVPTVTLPYTLLGAIVHSEPFAVYYGSSSATEPDPANLRIFVGANDGMLHAFNGVETTGLVKGKEVWAYMPSVIMSKMQFVLSSVDAVQFNSTVDGPLQFFHIDDGRGGGKMGDGFINGGEPAYLIFGYRRGLSVTVDCWDQNHDNVCQTSNPGKEDTNSDGVCDARDCSLQSYYTVLDISEAHKNKPKLVQHIPITGQSWSKPVIFRSGATYYLAFGGGYDPCFDDDGSNCTPPKGAQIHIYKYDDTTDPTNPYFVNEKTLTSADTAWLAAPVAAEGFAANTSGDLFYGTSSSYEGATEYLYFIDVSGTVFRVSVPSWSVSVIMTMRPNPGDAFGFNNGIRSYHSFLFYPPYNRYLKNDDAVSGRYLVPIPILTGNAVFPKEKGKPYELLVLWDRINPPSPQTPALYPHDFIDLTHVVPPATPPSYPSAYYTDPGNPPTADDLTNLRRGWRIDLNANGEKGMVAPLVYYNLDFDSYTVFATTYTTTVNTTTNPCANAGNSILYTRDLLTGLPPVLDDRYAQTTKCDAISLGEGLAASPKVTYGGRMPNDEMVMTSSGADVYVFSNELPPPMKTVRILKWYELY